MLLGIGATQKKNNTKCFYMLEICPAIRGTRRNTFRPRKSRRHLHSGVCPTSKNRNFICSKTLVLQKHLFEHSKLLSMNITPLPPSSFFSPISVNNHKLNVYICFFLLKTVQKNKRCSLNKRSHQNIF